MGTMNTLSIHPEWVWVMMHLGKLVENRSWGPPRKVRGNWLALHASAAIGGAKGHLRTLAALEGLERMAVVAGWSVRWVSKRLNARAVGKRTVKDRQMSLFPLTEAQNKFVLEFKRGDEVHIFDETKIPKMAVVGRCRIWTHEEMGGQRIVPEKAGLWCAVGSNYWWMYDVEWLNVPISCPGKQNIWQFEGYCG